MRAVVQRVTNASVVVGGKVVGEIGAGFLVLLGVAGNDTPEDADYLADKIAHLRIFNDEQGKMNLALEEIRGEVLIVSQFTLFGDARRGRRPSYTEAAEPNKANTLYEYMIEQLRGRGIRVATGVFQSMMQVNLTNDGPVTILLDSRKAF